MQTSPAAELAAHLAAPIKGRCFTKALRAWEAKRISLEAQIAKAARIERGALALVAAGLRAEGRVSL